MSRYSYPEFWRRVTHDGARLCAMRPRGGCHGHLDAHHIVRQQVLRKAAPEALTDERIGVPLCQRHHHLVTGAYERLRRDEVPAQAWAAAAEYGIRDELERELAEYHDERNARMRALRGRRAA